MIAPASENDVKLTSSADRDCGSHVKDVHVQRRKRRWVNPVEMWVVRTCLGRLSEKGSRRK